MSKVDSGNLIASRTAAETFGIQVEATLQQKLFDFIEGVRGTIRDPSRNWLGLEIVKALHRDVDSVSPQDRSKVLLISCDNCTDGAGAALNIDLVSLSPQTINSFDLSTANLSPGTSAKDTLLDDIHNGKPVFQFSAELLSMLQTKEAFVFVGDPANTEAALFKFISFLDNDFCRFLIDQKHTFFAIGSWSERYGFRYHDSDTDLCSKDVCKFGQDFWSR